MIIFKYVSGDSSRDLFYVPVGGHLTFERVTFSPSKKGHELNQLVDTCSLTN